MGTYIFRLVTFNCKIFRNEFNIEFDADSIEDALIELDGISKRQGFEILIKSIKLKLKSK